MTERYPSDSELLAIQADPATGVEMIPAGLSPYYIEFRRLVQRLILAAQRANDLRVYQDGDLTVGVRAGRCLVAGMAVDVAAVEGLTVTPSATTYFWIDQSGIPQTGTSAMPEDRSTFIPLAEVVADSTGITSLLDRRGEAFLQSPSAQSLGLTITAQRINELLAGINPGVDANAFNALTSGPDSPADALHGHVNSAQTADELVFFRFINDSADAAAGVSLALSLPNLMADDLVLMQNTTTGFLDQRFNGNTLTPICVSHAQYRWSGSLTASQSAQLIGVVPITGVVSDVVLSVGTNMQSSVSTDGLSALAKVNGASLTTTAPALTSAAGAGFKSTARGQGTVGVVKSDGTQNVQKGDVLTLDLTRTAVGTVGVEAADVVVMVCIRAATPE